MRAARTCCSSCSMRICSSRSASTFSRMVLRFLSELFSTRSLLSSELMSSSCSPMSFILAFCRQEAEAVWDTRVRPEWAVHGPRVCSQAGGSR